MITNSELTIYHLGLDETTRYEKYVRYNYKEVWCFRVQRASVNQGYDNTNQVQIRIPYKQNNGLNKTNFAKGDIIVIGNVQDDINTQDDLKGYEIYNITSINDNNFGNRPHIHLGGE